MNVSGLGAVVLATLALPIGASSQPQSLLDDAEKLMHQAAEQLLNSSDAMAFEIGKCSIVYPNGSTNPYVLKARMERAEINSANAAMLIERGESVSYAEGLQAARTERRSVRQCAADIEEKAQDVQSHTRGLLDLSRMIDAAATERERARQSPNGG